MVDKQASVDHPGAGNASGGVGVEQRGRGFRPKDKFDETGGRLFSEEEEGEDFPAPGWVPPPEVNRAVRSPVARRPTGNSGLNRTDGKQGYKKGQDMHMNQFKPDDGRIPSEQNDTQGAGDDYDPKRVTANAGAATNTGSTTNPGPYYNDGRQGDRRQSDKKGQDMHTNQFKPDNDRIPSEQNDSQNPGDYYGRGAGEGPGTRGFGGRRGWAPRRPSSQHYPNERGRPQNKQMATRGAHYPGGGAPGGRGQGPGTRSSQYPRRASGPTTEDGRVSIGSPPQTPGYNGTREGTGAGSGKPNKQGQKIQSPRPDRSQRPPNSPFDTKNAELDVKYAELGTELGTKNAGLETNKAGIETKNAELGNKNAGFGTKNAELGTELGTKNAGLGTKKTEPKTNNAELKTKNAELRTKNAGLETNNAGLETKNAELGAKNAGLETKNTELKTTICEMDEQILGLKDRDGDPTKPDSHFATGFSDISCAIEQWVLQHCPCGPTDPDIGSQSTELQELLGMASCEPEKNIGSHRVRVVGAVAAQLLLRRVFSSRFPGAPEAAQMMQDIMSRLESQGTFYQCQRWRALTMSVLAKGDDFEEGLAVYVDCVTEDIGALLSILSPPKPDNPRREKGLRDIVEQAVKLTIEIHKQPDLIFLSQVLPGSPYSAECMEDTSCNHTDSELEEGMATVKIQMFPTVLRRPCALDEDPPAVVMRAKVLAELPSRGEVPVE
ncbi:hypothetical protein Q9L58_004716 [Maublancomyces gigas]|uniref:Uncharacterized protein n=1 Tax=Discina gigas TaxID=1032678 RepID=A0ABR3GJY7_9PEZI